MLSKKEKSNDKSRDIAGCTSISQKQNVIIALLIVIISILLHQHLSRVFPSFFTSNFMKFSHSGNESSQNTIKNDVFVTSRKPVAWVTGQNMHHGYLGHVIKVFKQIGYEVHASLEAPSVAKWDVLWSHEYPFVKSFKLPLLTPLQKVNHFPGSGFITNKVNLATSGLKYVPKAFNLPREKDEFLQFVEKHPEKLWVQKDNNHRGIRVKNMSELNLEQTGTFVQEYIQNPLLIDGKKFDIGLYVTMTSVNPLRVYIYDNDALLRFCAQPYQPFNVTNLDSYVVGDLYTPTWEMPSLLPYSVKLNMNMKQTLNAYIREKLARDPSTVWNQMEESIKTIYYKMEDQITKITEMYPDQRNFFEMVRFDFMLDEELNAYLMEANMSPNLASAKFPPNKLLYEPVIYSLLSLTGLFRLSQARDWQNMPPDTEWDMYLLEKDLSVLPDICSKPECHIHNETTSGCESGDHCDICFHCLSSQFKLTLKDSYLEEHSRYHNKRLIPSTSVAPDISLGYENHLLEKWFIGKCLQDSRWCN